MTAQISDVAALTGWLVQEGLSGRWGRGGQLNLSWVIIIVHISPLSHATGESGSQESLSWAASHDSSSRHSLINL